MARTHPRYRKDSPEAVAAVLAALLVGDGRLDPREIDLLDRLGVFGIVDVPRETFLRAVAREHAALVARSPGPDDGRVARRARLDAALDAVSQRERRLVVCAVLLYLAEADHVIDEQEVACVRRAFDRWGVTALELERELNVPRHRTRAFFGGLAVAPA